MDSLKNLVLVGFMGSGKSMTSKKLGVILLRDVVSTDELIVKREGREIADIFRDSGEPYFRKVEKEVVSAVAQQTGLIIDCGGGVVLDPENLANLKRNGIVFYLSASADYIYQNIKDQTHRPLLKVPDPEKKIEEMVKERQPFYAQADIVIDANKTIDKIAEDILRVVNDE